MSLKRWIICLLCVTMCFCIPVVFNETAVTAFALDEDELEEAEDSLKELNSKIDQLEQQQQKIQQQINSTKNEKQKQIAIKQQLDKQIDITKNQIYLLSEKITTMEGEMKTTEQQIEEKEMEIEDGLTQFKKRIRANYMAGENTSLGLILGAESFAEALTRARVINTIAEHDQKMVDQLMEDKAELEALKVQLGDEKKVIEATKQQQDAKQSQLNGQLKNTEKQIQDISLLEQSYLADKAATDRMLAQVQAEVDAIYAQINSTGQYDGGKMQWPVPGFTQVTSKYGWRFNGTDYHTGIDISGAGVYGHNIVAAADGTVAYVQHSYVQGRGYGIYLILDHGGGVTTLYGHTSALTVQKGQKVARGQTIAKVGSTGWSTGPHLHFEVRVNGKHTNPAAYLY